MRNKIFAIIFVLSFILAVIFINADGVNSQADENTTKDYFIITSQKDRLIDELDSLNGIIKSSYGDAALEININEKNFNLLDSKIDIKFYSQEIIDINQIKQYGQDAESAARMWNYTLTQVNTVPANDPGPIEGDLLFHQMPNIGGPEITPGETYGRGFYDTSEFMLGKVSVAAFLVESDGGIDTSTENWDSEREDSVHGEIKIGAQWWQDKGDNLADLSFKYHFIDGRKDGRAKTKYEPIKRDSWTKSGGQDLWIAEIMNKMGYSSGDYFDQVRDYLNDLIKNDNSDWAFAVFVVDSKNDGDGRFKDNKFAYSYYGGPFLVMTYDNNGYGINNMDSVLAHEMGHTFFALDQYYSAMQPCTRSVGYLNIQNQNSEYNPNGGSCATDKPSIMRGSVTPFINKQIDYYAKGQIGWRDSDNDNIPDIIDTFPNTNIISSVNSSDTTPTISGTAEVYRLENKNPYYSTSRSGSSYEMTINEIKAVQYRVNGGSWKSAVAKDGNFNEPVEDFKFTVSKLSQGIHKVETRAKNSVGNWEKSPAVQNIVIGNTRIITGAGFSGGPQVRQFNQLGDLQHLGFFAYEEHVRNGVKVAAGDVDGDGKDEIITGTGDGSGPHIRIFESDGSVQSPGFFAYEEHFRGGVNVVAGDLDGDGIDEIIAGAGVNGGPHVRVFDQNGTPKLTAGFFAFDPGFRGGVTVATGDIDGDGIDEIITGAGTGGGPHVRIFEGDGTLKPNSFFAFHPDSRTGVDVAAGDFDGDGIDDVAVSQLANGEAWTKIYKYNDQQTILGEFRAYGEGVETGVNITAFDIDYDGRAELITGPGMGGGPQVRIFEADGTPVYNSFFAYADWFRGGTYLAVGNF